MRPYGYVCAVSLHGAPRPVAPCSIILRLAQSEWRMVDRYNHFPSSILHSQLKTPERASFRGFSLSKKYYFNFYASCGSTHKIEFAKQIHKFREHVSRNLYKGRKNVPVRARFFFGIRSKAWFRARDCSENVSFSTVSNPGKNFFPGFCIMLRFSYPSGARY